MDIVATTTKQIRISEKYRDSLEAALAEANGRLTRYLTVDDLLGTARKAETLLKQMEVSKEDRPGSTATTAEEKSPWKSHAITIARATLVRRKTGWFLQKASRGYSSGKCARLHTAKDSVAYGYYL